MLKLLLACAAVVALAPVALAQDKACLGLGDVMSLAARTSPDVATRKALKREAEAGVTSARSLFRPQISTFARTGAGDVGLVDSEIQSQVGLRVTQRLFDFGNARFSREAAKESAKASEYEVKAAEITAAHEAAATLLQLLNASRAIEATELRRDYFQKQLSVVERLLEAGAATLSERAEVAAELAEAEAFYEELEFQKASASTRLSIYTGSQAPPCTEDALVAEISALTAGFSDIETASQMALERNPELDALSANASSLAAMEKREKRNWLPVISAVGISSYASSGDGRNYELQDRIGVDVTVPLYSGNALSAERDKAGAQESAARSRLSGARRQVDEEVRVTFQRILSLGAQLRNRETVEARTREQFEAAEQEFEAGTRTLPDLVEARLKYEDSTLRRIEVTFDLMGQKLILLNLTGADPLGNALP
jgi:outer membrane protein TolC